MTDKEIVLNELPEKLKMDLNNFLYEKDFKGIPFFEKQSPMFLAAIGPMLKPIKFQKNEIVFLKDDPLDCSK